MKNADKDEEMRGMKKPEPLNCGSGKTTNYLDPYLHTVVVVLSSNLGVGLPHSSESMGVGTLESAGEVHIGISK